MKRRSTDPRTRALEEIVMPVVYVVGAVTSVALFIYLLVAMLRPEKFE